MFRLAYLTYLGQALDDRKMVSPWYLIFVESRRIAQNTATIGETNEHTVSNLAQGDLDMADSSETLTLSWIIGTTGSTGTPQPVSTAPWIMGTTTPVLESTT
ncbi:MAG: hypothetical protein M1816_006429 [Peltula sp. TS41687]|nr:MAG: hypothetical protein M1816_006429 [Peltula sp. TS41687]